MPADRSIRAKVRLPFLLVCVVLGAALGAMMIAGVVTMRAVDVADTEARRLARAGEAARLFVDMESGQRGFVITGRDEFLEPYARAEQQLGRVLGVLESECSDDPTAAPLVERYQYLWHKWLGQSGLPEIELRRTIRGAAIHLESIGEMLAAGPSELDALLADIAAIASDREVLERVRRDALQAENALRGFLLSGSERFLARFHQARLAVKNELAELAPRYGALRARFVRWIEIEATPAIDMRIAYEQEPRTMDDLAALLGKGTGRRIVDDARTTMTALTKHLSARVAKAKREAERVTNVSIAISVLATLAALWLGTLLMRRAVRGVLVPVGALLEGARAIGRGDLDHRVTVIERDELGALAGEFNSMAGSLAQAQAALRDTHAQLLHAGKMAAVGTLIAGLSHELNNPIGVIVGSVQNTLKRVGEDAPVRPALQAIERQAKRCGQLVRSLLEFSRNTPEPRERLKVGTILDRVLELAHGHAQRRDVKLVARIASRESTVVACSREVDSALLNLITNAIDASPTGGEVTVVASARARGVEIRVRDRGTGIPAEVLPRIFEPFFTTKPTGQGTGLGLSITMNIVESLGGALAVTSTSPAGTEFRLWLPAEGDK